jgi:hypothetical protein
MARDVAPERPAEALRQAVEGAAIGFLGSHPILRFIVGVIGAVLFLVGVVAAPFWEVPLLSWLSAGQVAATCLAGGVATLGICYVSGRRKPVTPNRQRRP